jgi:hypothetical protein
MGILNYTKKTWVDYASAGPFLEATNLNEWEDLFASLDMLGQLVVKGLSSTPPGSPADHDTWLLGNGCTGAWSGHDQDIAKWDETASAWTFTDSQTGWQAVEPVYGDTYTKSAGGWENKSSSDLVYARTSLTIAATHRLSDAGSNFLKLEGPSAEVRSLALAHANSALRISTDTYLTRPSASTFRISSDGSTGAASLDIRGALTVGTTLNAGATTVTTLSAGATTVTGLTITGATQYQVPHIAAGGGGVTTSPNLKFDGNVFSVLGAQIRNVTFNSGSASVGASDYNVTYTGGGGHTATLPAATGSGREIEFDNAGSAGNWTIAKAGSDTIQGSGNIVTSPGQSFTLRDSASGAWRIVRAYP